MSVFGKSVRALLVGGIFFILPLVLIIFLVSKALQFLSPLIRKIIDYTSIHTLFGAATVTVVGIFVLLLICLLAGLLLEKGFLKSWGHGLEEKIFLVFPNLRLLKYQYLDENNVNSPYKWEGILLKEEPGFRIAFIVDRSSGDYLTLYIPDVPRMDAGEVRYIKASDCEYHKISMREAYKAATRFGKGIQVEEIVKKAES